MGSPDRRLRGGCVAARRATPEMSSAMGKLTAAAPVPVGTVEPPAPCARPSGNGQDIAACRRLGSGASPPSAAGLPVLLSVASLGSDLPCTDNPGLFFAELPDDVETAKALCRECPARATCLAGALKRREPWGVWGGELFLRGAIVPRKRPRGRPRKTDVAA